MMQIEHLDFFKDRLQVIDEIGTAKARDPTTEPVRRWYDYHARLEDLNADLMRFLVPELRGAEVMWVPRDRARCSKILAAVEAMTSSLTVVESVIRELDDLGGPWLRSIKQSISDAKNRISFLDHNTREEAVRVARESRHEDLSTALAADPKYQEKSELKKVETARLTGYIEERQQLLATVEKILSKLDDLPA